jgi:hypothetical protein
MNLALLAHSTVFEPLHSLMRWLVTSNGTLPCQISNPTQSYSDIRLQPMPQKIRAVERGNRPLFRNKPLRVVSIYEAGQERCTAGRMRISGRMADVCAELDRLAAREALI